MKTEVLLTGDLGGWPLWKSFGDDILEPTRPEDWPMLSVELKDALLAWNDDFLSPSRPSLLPWRRRREFRSYVANAHMLAGRVQSELGTDFDVRWSA